MDKAEFNSLPIEDQIGTINRMIRKYKSATKAIKAVGFDESTLRKRFKNNGYVLNTNKTAYVSINDKGDTVVIDDSDTVVNNNSDTSLRSSKEILDKINSLTKELMEFEALKKEIIEMLNWYKTQEKNKISNLQIPIIKIDTEKLSKEHATTRGVKMYPNVFDDFKEFCSQHKEYRMQDLIAMALLEYKNKYK